MNTTGTDAPAICLLSNAPVCKLIGTEFLPISGKTFAQQVVEYFNG